MTNSQKRNAVLAAFKNGPLNAAELRTKTKMDPTELRTICKALMAEKALVPADAGKLKLPATKAAAPAKRDAAPAPAPAKAKLVKKSAPAPEPEPEDEDTYSDEDIEAFTEEYEALSEKKALTKKEKERLAELEEVLESVGAFGTDEDEEVPEEEVEDEDEPEAEDEAEEEVDLDALIDEYNELAEQTKLSKIEKARLAELEEYLTEAGAFGDAEDGEPEAEDEDGDGEDHDFDGDEDADFDTDEDDEPAPAKGGKSKVKSKATVDPSKDFTMAYKPVDQLTADELSERMIEGKEVAADLHEQGFVNAAELIMRSVAKLNRQLNKRA